MNADVKELDSLPRKFLFDEQHDLNDAAKEKAKQDKHAESEEAKRASAELKKADLKKAHDAGYAHGAEKGYLEGYKTAWSEAQAQCLEAAKQHSDQLSAQALETIANRILNAGQQMDIAYENAQKAAASIAIVMARKLAQKALEETPDDDIAAMVSEVLSQMDAEKRLTLKVNPHIIESLQPKLNALAQAAGFHGTIEVRGVADLSPTDARLTWQEGGAQRIFEHLASQIDDVIGRHFHTENMSEEAEDIPGVMAPDEADTPETAESTPQQAVTEFIYTGEAPVPSVPLEITEAGDIALPEDLTTPPSAPAETPSEEPEPPSAQDPAADAAESDADDVTDAVNPAPTPNDASLTGTLAIHEFSDEMPPPKKTGFETINMNQFEQLDEDA